MNTLTITPFNPGSTISVSQGVYTAMQSVINIVGALTTPNAITFSQLYQQMDALLISLSINDLTVVTNLLVSNKFIRYCPILGTFYAPPSGIRALNTVFTIVAS